MGTGADRHKVVRAPAAVSARPSAETMSRAAASSGPEDDLSAAVRDLQIEYVAPERLRLSPTNARTHSQRQIKLIARSIGRFGFVNPILISDDFEILAGHGRVAAAKALGLRQVPTIRLSNLSAAERRAYVIADNRLAELAGWDRELLATELQGLLDVQFDDIELTGFSLGDVALLVDEPAEKKTKVRPDKRPAVSRVGDVWVLGPHRLQCGDGDQHCDLVVRHWQQYTGQRARLEGSDLHFAEVEALRLAGRGAPEREPEE